MTKNSDNSTNSNIANSKHPSAEIILAYTQDFYKIVSSDLERLGIKISTLIGFNGVLLRFTQSLPGRAPSINTLPCTSCLWLKILCCVFTLLSIAYCIRGFISKPTGNIPDPSDLTKVDIPEFPNGWRDIHPDSTKMEIAKVIAETLDEFDEKRKEKSENLNNAIYFFAAASFCFGIDIILDATLRGT